MKFYARVLTGAFTGVLVLWCSLALAFRLPGPAWWTRAVAVVFGLAMLGTLLAVRPFRKALGICFVALGVVFLWWSTIQPSNDRDWLPEVARLPTAEVDGDRLIVRNVRNFEYRSETDYDERWEDRIYDLSRLRGVDLFVSYWGSPYIAHPILSWDFGGDEHLAFSIETRKERGEQYSTIRGFFREYELMYIAADERDVVRLRTNHRGEDVYLYRLRIDPQVARALLLAYAEHANDLARRPQFYNAAIDNCTTGIRVNVQHIGAAQPWDYRLLINGLGDRMLYERGRIDTSMPFEQIKRASRITEKAKAAGQAPDFSRRIRQGLPHSPPP